MRLLTWILVCLAIACPAHAQDGHTARGANTGFDINDQVIETFAQAWQACGKGVSDDERVILLYRMADGFLRARLLIRTNEFKEARFKWDPAARAIIHTHPNSTGEEPSYQDLQLADRLRVPVYTITNRGMFMYDPQFKRTCKVQAGLDWLKPSGWGLKSCLARSG